jgi:SAM-dependent methyltransferase
VDPGPYEAIADVYDLWCAEVTEDVAFYRAACEGAEGPVVELGAGSGRIAVPLALDGHEVVAVDRSPGMLARLASRAAVAGVEDRIRPLEGDLELVELPRTDRVIAPFRTLLHVPDSARRLALLQRIRAALEPGGRFVFDVFEPTRQDVKSTHERWLERDSGVRERASWVPADAHLDLEVRFRGRETTMRLHWVQGGWAPLLEQAGFEVVAAYAGFDGEPYRGRPGDSAWIAEAAAR